MARIADMMTGRLIAAVLVACVLAGIAIARNDPAQAAGPCGSLTHDGNAYTVCSIDLRRHDMRLFWTDESGSPYQWFHALPQAHNGGRLVFAMNAGMYDADYRPVGLYVEEGRQRRPANTNTGPGNFHLLPNGVFFVAGNRAGVMETERFLSERPVVDLATQSGPMLVIDGEIHHRFIPGGSSRKRRNGVGVTDDGIVVFAITEGLVNFWDFGRLFRDRLGIDNALFLDGTMSSLYAPDLGREDRRRPMGPMIAAFDGR